MYVCHVCVYVAICTHIALKPFSFGAERRLDALLVSRL